MSFTTILIGLVERSLPCITCTIGNNPHPIDMTLDLVDVEIQHLTF